MMAVALMQVADTAGPAVAGPLDEAGYAGSQCSMVSCSVCLPFHSLTAMR